MNKKTAPEQEVIYITRDGGGYHVSAGRHYANLEEPYFKEAKGVTFPEAIEALTNLGNRYLARGTRLRIDESPDEDIDPKEAHAFIKLVSRLEELTREYVEVQGKVLQARNALAE